jgi:polyferredoxin
MTNADHTQKPHKFKHSDTKIWMRSGILIIFSSIFGWSLYHDVIARILSMSWALGIFIPLLGVGFWMSRLVPMQVHSVFEVITISFDRIYFGLILILVILKDVAGDFLKINVAADIIMCVILGLMVGRLSGIYIRVNNLKSTEFSRQ